MDMWTWKVGGCHEDADGSFTRTRKASSDAADGLLMCLYVTSPLVFCARETQMNLLLVTDSRFHRRVLLQGLWCALLNEMTRV